MKINCEHIQETLLERSDINAPLSEEIKSHLAECSDCSEIYASLLALNKIEAKLPEYKAPATTVEKMLARINSSAPQEAKKVSLPINLRWSIIALLLGAFLGCVYFINKSNSIIAIPNLIPKALLIIEGSIGALMMLALAALATYMAFIKRIKMTGALATCALMMFVLRSSLNTFFNNPIQSRFSEIAGRKAIVMAPSEQYGVTERDQELGVNEVNKLAEVGHAGKPMDRAANIADEEKEVYYDDKRDNDNNAFGGGLLRQDMYQYEKRAAEEFDKLIEQNERNAQSTRSIEPKTYKLTEPAVILEETKKLNEPRADSPKLEARKHSEPGMASSADQQVSKLKSINEEMAKELDKRSHLMRENELRAQDLITIDINSERSASEKEMATPSKLKSDRWVARRYMSEDELKKGAEFMKQRVEKLTGGNFPTDGVPHPVTMNAIQPSSDVVARFWAERSQVDNLRFLPSKGYYSNTYIPGDPALRALVARLAANDKNLLSRYAGRTLELEKNSRLATQPLDIPKGAALGISLSSDQKAISGPTRMLLQVNLKAAERKSILRPAMKAMIVLDASAIPNPELIRAVLTSFDRAKVAGDQFSLIVAGPRGGTYIPLGEYRFGTVEAALSKLTSEAVEGIENLSVPQALERAVNELKKEQNSTTSFGTDSIIFVSGAKYDMQTTDKLTELAYKSALDGLPVSSIALGAGDYEALGAIAIGGQGERRQVLNASEAEGVVKNGLSAVSRCVARALRINIRLNPGVKLVEVLGSKNLAEEMAQKLRVAEQALDKRMAKDFGITSDRGADDDGIQIIIPAFYSSDAHVILLDVVANAPGTLAEVSVKYKDLIEHKNGVSQAALAVANGQFGEDRDPIVMKNLLSFKLAETFNQAVNAMSEGNINLASTALEQHKTLIIGIQNSIATLKDDSDLKRDLIMIDEYLILLRTQAAQNDQARRAIVQSMQLAAKQKISAPKSE